MIYIYSITSAISWIVIYLTQDAKLKFSENFAIINTLQLSESLDFTRFHYIVSDLKLYILFRPTPRPIYVYISDTAHSAIKAHDQNPITRSHSLDDLSAVQGHRQFLPGDITYILAGANPAFSNKIKQEFLDKYNPIPTTYPHVILPNVMKYFNITNSIYWFVVYFDHGIYPSLEEDIGIIDVNPPKIEVPFYYIMEGQKMYVVLSRTKSGALSFLYLRKGVFQKVLAQDIDQMEQAGSEFIGSLKEQKRDVDPAVLDESKYQEVITNLPESFALPESIKSKFYKKYSTTTTSAPTTTSVLTTFISEIGANKQSTTIPSNNSTSYFEPIPLTNG
nr:hypothetical protein [Abalone asfa-like virus]